MSKVSDEWLEAVAMAKVILGRDFQDKDSTESLLARQLLQAEQVNNLLKEIIDKFETNQMIDANRDTILRIHREGVDLIHEHLIQRGLSSDLRYIKNVIVAIYTFHPMYGESWIGWPKE